MKRDNMDKLDQVREQLMQLQLDYQKRMKQIVTLLEEIATDEDWDEDDEELDDLDEVTVSHIEEIFGDDVE